MSVNLGNNQINSDYLKVTKVDLFNNKTIVYTLSGSKKIRDSLLSDRVFVEYDKSLNDLDKSVLNIPIVAGLITIAWAYGADFFVEAIDQNYLHSLRAVKNVMKKSFDFPFSEIKANQITPNTFCSDRHGLLFSCGVDSVTSYIKHQTKKPELIYVRGVDVRSDDNESWKYTLEMLNNFSEKAGTEINIIRTNIYEIVDRDLLRRTFDLDWWQNVNHGIALTGLAAPLTCALGLKVLYVAPETTHAMGFTGLSGTSPKIVNNISWASTQARIDNPELTRQMEIRKYLKEFTENVFFPFLKVCNKYEEPGSNCGVCEKCYRTIIGLAVEGIDANKCGFKNINRETFNAIKSRFDTKNLLTKKTFVESKAQFNTRTETYYFWDDIHRHIPKEITHNVCDSKEFLEWFRDFDLSGYLKQAEDSVVLSPSHILLYVAASLIGKCPKNIRIVLNQLLTHLAHHYEKVRWKNVLDTGNVIQQ